MEEEIQKTKRINDNTSSTNDSLNQTKRINEASNSIEDSTNQTKRILEETSKEIQKENDITLNEEKKKNEKIQFKNLRESVILNNKEYAIVKPLSRASGEAEVYLVEHKGEKYVWKYYYPAFKPKDEIVESLKGFKHEDIIELIDYGYYKERFFEILEYAEGGSILEKDEKGNFRYIPIKDVKKIKEIVKEINNALKECHNRGIIHRDIKPENIFYVNKEGKDLKIGDFGISSTLDEGISKHITGQARTEIYAAPELYQSIKGKTIITKEVDYYALGITLIYLWSGEEPFKGLSPYSIMRVKMESKVYLPEDMPEKIKKLIKGLITVEPTKRWGYKEVEKWLKDKEVEVYYVESETEYPDFRFGRIEGKEVKVKSPEELSKMIEKYPEIGKKHLYKGTIADWLRNIDQSMYVEIRSIVEDDYPSDHLSGLIKAIYVLDPYRGFKSVSGEECNTAEEIGNAIEKNFKHYIDCIMNNKPLDFIIYLEARGEKEIVEAFRNYIKAYKEEKALNRIISLNRIILELQGKDKFKIGSYIFYKPEDILKADVKTKEQLAKLLSYPDSKFSLWMEQFSNFKNSINKWRKSRKYDAITLMYVIEENSPFHFYYDLAYSKEDIKKFYIKYIKEQDKIEELMNVDSAILKEVNYWLKNYKMYLIDVYDIIIDILKTETQVLVDINENKIEQLINGLIAKGKVVSKREIDKKILEIEGSYKFHNYEFKKPEDILKVDRETKEQLAKLLSDPDSKFSLWIEQFSNLKSSVEKWRNLGRYDAITLTYAIEENNPFHFYNDLAYSKEDIKKFYIKYIKEQDKIEELMNVDSAILKEVNYWLKNYKMYLIDVYDIIIDILKTETQVLVDINENKIEQLINGLIAKGKVLPKREINKKILEIEENYKFHKYIFKKPEDILKVDTETKEQLAKLLSDPDSKFSVWIEQFSNLKANIEKWRNLGRYDAITLTYAIEENNPFHFYEDLVYTVEDFKRIYKKYFTNPDKIEELMNINSALLKEAEYWFKHYQNQDLKDTIIEILKKEEKLIFQLDKINRDKFVSLLTEWINELHKEKNMIKLDDLEELFEYINFRFKVLMFFYDDNQNCIEDTYTEILKELFYKRHKFLIKNTYLRDNSIKYNDFYNNYFLKKLEKYKIFVNNFFKYDLYSSFHTWTLEWLEKYEKFITIDKNKIIDIYNKNNYTEIIEYIEFLKKEPLNVLFDNTYFNLFLNKLKIPLWINELINRYIYEEVKEEKILPKLDGYINYLEIINKNHEWIKRYKLVKKNIDIFIEDSKNKIIEKIFSFSYGLIFFNLILSIIFYVSIYFFENILNNLFVSIIIYYILFKQLFLNLYFIYFIVNLINDNLKLSYDTKTKKINFEDNPYINFKGCLIFLLLLFTIILFKKTLLFYSISILIISVILFVLKRNSFKNKIKNLSIISNKNFKDYLKNNLIEIALEVLSMDDDTLEKTLQSYGK